MITRLFLMARTLLVGAGLSISTKLSMVLCDVAKAVAELFTPTKTIRISLCGLSINYQ